MQVFAFDNVNMPQILLLMLQYFFCIFRITLVNTAHIMPHFSRIYLLSNKLDKVKLSVLNRIPLVPFCFYVPKYLRTQFSHVPTWLAFHGHFCPL